MRIKVDHGSVSVCGSTVGFGYCVVADKSFRLLALFPFNGGRYIGVRFRVIMLCD